MSDLHNLITNTLGVAPQAPVAAPSKSFLTSPSAKGWAPPRPEPTYEYTLSLSRTEYGSVVVVGTSKQDAMDNLEYSEIDWYDASDSIVIDYEESPVPSNQDELEEWDDEYSAKYDTDGQPKCSTCGYLAQSSDELHNAPDDAEWYCDDCAPESTSTPE